MPLIGTAITENSHTLRLASWKGTFPAIPLKKFMPKNEDTKVAGRKAIVTQAMPRIVRLSL
jgi:hypothetical protein